MSDWIDAINWDALDDDGVVQKLLERSSLTETEVNRVLDKLSVAGETSNTTILYSGLPDNELKALIDHATENNLRIIDETQRGKVLNNTNFQDLLNDVTGSPSSANEFLYGIGDGKTGVWARASESFVSHANGNIEIHLGNKPNINGVFSQTELNAILNRPEVTHINGLPKADVRAALNKIDDIHIAFLGNTQNAYLSAFENKCRILRNATTFAHNPAVRAYLHKLGIVGTIMGLSLTIAMANAALESGHPDEAKGILARYIISEAGGATAGLAFMSAASRVLAAFARSYPIISGTIVLTGSFIASIVGAEMAEAVADYVNGLLGWERAGETGRPLLSQQALKTELHNDFTTAEFTRSPLVLDLDGDGVETVSAGDGTFFDHDGNGFAERTGWIKGDDGLLVRDINGNGQIDNGSELFGDQTLLSNGKNAANGFEALAECV